MAITFTAGTAVESTGSQTSTTVTLPAGLADGDYTIIAFSLNATNGVITTPSGWTNILASTNSANGSTSDAHAIFYRKWVSGDTNPSVTTSNGRVAATPIKVSGADGTTFVNTAASVTQAASGATTLTAPTITPSSTTLVCTFNGRRGGNGQFLTPYSNLSASMTAIAEASGKATNATNAGHQIAFEVVTANSATGTRQSNPAGATTGAMGVSFALNEGSSAVTASPTAIASGEAFGTAAVMPAQPTGIASAEAFGTVTVGPAAPTGIASEEAFGTPTVGPVQPTGIPSDESFGNPSVGGVTAISIEGSPSVYESASSTTAVVPYPSGIVAGELLTAHVTFSGATPPSNTPPTGWTLGLNIDGGAGVQTSTWYKVATGSESGSVTWTSTAAAGRTTGIIIRWSGVDNTTPLDVASVSQTTGGTGNSVTAPSQTIVTAGAKVVTTVSLNASTSSDITTPSGWAKDSGSTGTGRRMSVYDKTFAATGATGTTQYDQNPPVSSLEMVAISMALRPAASAGTTASPSGIASAEAFGTPAVMPAQPTGIASGETFGAVVAALVLLVSPGGIASGQAFGTPTANSGYIATPTGISTAEAFGTATAVVPITASPSGVASGEAFGTPVESGLLTCSPSGIASAEVFGTPTETGLLTVSPSAIPSAEAFGTPVETGLLTVTPTGIGTAEAFGTAAANVPVTASPAGIASGEAFGGPVASSGYVASPVGITSAEVFGTVTAQVPITAAPTGIASAGIVSNAVAVLTYTASPTGIASAQAMGTPSTTNVLTVQPSSFGGEQFGTPSAVLTLTATAVGIPTQAQPGFPVVTYVTTMAPAGIPSAEAFGTPFATIGVNTGRDLLLSFVDRGRPLAATAIPERWGVAEIDRGLAGGAFIPVLMFDVLERPLTASLMDGDTVERTIMKSAGASEYVGGIITEETGKDITAAVIRLALGSASDPGTWQIPANDTTGPVNVRKVTILVGLTPNTPKGEYWVWAKVTDGPEVTTLRLPQKVVVR